MNLELLIKYTKTLSVLFVEDELGARETGAEVFSLFFGFVYTAKNGEEGLSLYREKKPDVVISDIQMPTMNGLDMVRKIREDNQDIPVIITTAYSDEKYFLDSIKLGIDRYVIKPISKEQCLDAVMFVAKRLMDKENAALFEKERAERLAKEAADDAFRRAVYTDRLTGLPSRYSLMDHLTFNSTSSLLVINIDRLKDINKIYGVKTGDKAIVRVAQMLGEWAKTRCGFMVCSMGGDEFALYFLEACRVELEEVAKEIIDKIENESFKVDDLEISLSATIGIAFNSKRPIEDAETALKIAKQKKKRFLVYEEIELQDDKQTNNILWYQKIKEALKEGRIVPYYQPIVSTVDKQTTKFECLVRLIEPDGKVVSPAYFLDVAKQSRLYAEITKELVRRVVAECKNLSHEISINLSVEDMSSVDTAEAIYEVVKESGMGSRIVFEILESEGIESFDEVSVFIDRLKSLGCRFSIDDFGTGYSNFIYLLKLNVDYLKIDGSLIQKIPNDASVKKAVDAINSFAHGIGIKTIAEFVSEEAIYDEVKMLGIDYCQGYFFSPPIADINVVKK